MPNCGITIDTAGAKRVEKKLEQKSQISLLNVRPPAAGDVEQEAHGDSQFELIT